MEISDGEFVVFDVCPVLNTKVCPKLQASSKDENLLLQLNSAKNLFEKFSKVSIDSLIDRIDSVSIDSLIDGCSDINQYAYHYLEIEHTQPMKLWGKLLIIG